MSIISNENKMMSKMDGSREQNFSHQNEISEQELEKKFEERGKAITLVKFYSNWIYFIRNASEQGKG